MVDVLDAQSDDAFQLGSPLAELDAPGAAESLKPVPAAQPEDKLDEAWPGGPSAATSLLLKRLNLNDAAAATTEGFAQGVTYTERYADGSVYVGTFGKNGREGEGRLTYANGDSYLGQFRGDARHLQGRLCYACGDTYEGEFYRDELEGHGVFKYRDGWCYEGEFHGSKIHGQGLLSFARTDFPAELLKTDQLCGEEQPAVMASRIPGSLHQLLALTREWGRYQGKFRNGLRHGEGRMEFLVPASSSAASPTEAQVEPHFVETVWEDGLRHGRGVVHIAGYLRYEGEFDSDEANGQGKLVRWFQGGEQDVFEGEFRNGSVHGFANYSGPDGTVYRGQFVDGLRQGNGELSVRGTSYTGEFFQGARHGVGRYRSAKASYSGHYHGDQRHGAGLLREWEKDGKERVYEGEFVASMRQGQGKLKNAECSFSGTWHHNVRHGAGRQTWHDSGNSYEGQWQDDKMHGEGTLITAAVKYTGQFSKGVQYGTGLQIWWKAGGDSYEGQFHASRPHGTGVYKLVSRGESYEGTMENGVMGGEGIYTYADGSIYEGQWLKGKQHGQGQLTYQDGTLYQGQFRDDAFHGKGTFIEPSGCVHMGSFARNVRCGEINVLHPDGQREMRRYDYEGQEIERRLQPKVIRVSLKPQIGQWHMRSSTISSLGSFPGSPKSLPSSPKSPASPIAMVRGTSQFLPTLEIHAEEDDVQKNTLPTLEEDGE